MGSVLMGRFVRERAVEPCDETYFFPGSLSIASGSLTLDRRPALFLRLVDLADRWLVAVNATIDAAGRLQAYANFLSLLNHPFAEGVVVEVMITLQIEELAVRRAPVQDDVRVRMGPVLVDRDEVVEPPSFLTEEALAQLARDGSDVLALRADRKRHDHVGRMAKLRAEPLVPCAREPIRNFRDLIGVQLGLTVVDAATVDDMRRLGREVC
nr:hypothetical protein [Fulvimarina endophytica]